MKNKTCVKYLPCETECPWHKKFNKQGRVYKPDEVFPKNVCPILYHTLYPYFLGAMYGAKFTYNDKGDCDVCCPAVKSVDLIVKTRPNDGSFGDDVTSDRKKVFYAEVVKVNGDCPYNHKVGEKIIFPISNREKYFDIMLQRLEKYTGQDIREHIEYKKSYCVKDFEQDYHAYDGNAYGLANTLTQTANLKPKIINKKIKNLYYTGQLTVPGPGVPPSLISGQVVAKHIIKSNKW